MNLKYSLKTSFEALRANKSRSVLTILGIVIGITAIILIMSIGQGGQDLILSQIQGMGATTLAVQPGREPKGFSDMASLFSDSLKEKDYLALKKKSNVPSVVEVMPEVITSATLSFEGETKQVSVIGASEVLAEILNIYPSEGSFFTEEDIIARNSVVVIGSEVREDLFGFSEAVGQKIRIKNRDFRVVGVFPQKGQVSMFNMDSMAVVPHTTAQKYLTGTNYYNEIILKAVSEAAVPQAVREIEATLRESHNITDPSKDDFQIHTQADLVERVSTITNILTALLLSIATISLIVGGIGIMNIMLVSVTERTREIGLRKAVGATQKDILTQFLLESVLLTGIGGVIGIIAGAILAFLISLILSQVLKLNWAFSFPVSAAIAGLLVAGLVGLIFGIYPAKKAAAKDPIEALRYE
ncbi:ABC transporter permease [Candidatus Parcubacteria bacterium]|nr:ABC transporter permease [Patescibacteria group bacterium]MBU4466982.1 ABC transporter permease [Patescibacteria group bacterium]MCG2688075.1 ABC transporter permease [Candidatus Parcubacteria bacterium]